MLKLEFWMEIVALGTTPGLDRPEDVSQLSSYLDGAIVANNKTQNPACLARDNAAKAMRCS